jgi:hypothetical protein
MSLPQSTPEPSLLFGFIGLGTLGLVSKKNWVKKTRPTKKPHVSTAKILSQNQLQKQTP